MACTKDILPPSERNDILRFSRKALAATATLGTGNSLGPEGPSVEAGMSISRLLMNNEFFSQLTMVFGTLEDNYMSEVKRVNRKLSRDRLLLACGAAAGVSAGFWPALAQRAPAALCQERLKLAFSLLGVCLCLVLSRCPRQHDHSVPRSDKDRGQRWLWDRVLSMRIAVCLVGQCPLDVTVGLMLHA